MSFHVMTPKQALPVAKLSLKAHKTRAGTEVGMLTGKSRAPKLPSRKPRAYERSLGGTEKVENLFDRTGRRSSFAERKRARLG